MTRARLGWLLVVLQFVLLIVLVLLPHRSATLLSLVVGVPLMAAGVVLGLVASRRLGSALTPTPVPIAEAGLRTDGVYAQVRHPIYSAILLAALGFAIALGSWWTLLGVAVLAAFFSIKYRWEDRLLAQEYGSAWQEWAARTGALVPRIRRD